MSRCKSGSCGSTITDCGMNGVSDFRCCYYCEYKSKCEGFCAILEDFGDYEDVAKECEEFSEE